MGKICCASEIPAINDIIEPMECVSKVSINVTTKMVRGKADYSFQYLVSICSHLLLIYRYMLSMIPLLFQLKRYVTL